MALTDIEIKSAKGRDKPYKLADGGWLYLVVNPSGSKLWRMAYRFDGKERLLSLGAYPLVSLKDARAKRDEAKAALLAGIDPGEQKKRDKAAAALSQGNTFNVIADELIAKKRREGKSETTLSKNEWALSFVRPTLGDRPISEITAADVLGVLRQVEARGRHETAGRLRALIGQVFRYAIATARADNDPTFALRGALTTPTTKHRAAITDPAELGAFLRALDGYEARGATLAAMRLLPLVFTRPGELRLAEWAEIDMANAVWTIPASRTKMRREHQVPLCRQALAILSELHTMTGDGRLVFPGLRTAERPISENTMNAALRRLGYSQDEVTAHGFRATASTLLNESGKFSADAIERALAHQDPDPVRRAYARGVFWQERVEMAQWWADYLDRLKAGGEVVPLKKRAE
ncbi:integrase [Rhodoblastus sphagnicola]|uniref:Integrase n=2 Tax=Rhodoblastus sphagnicola TaxID=333368 RepID=A0A2S6MWB4_9HYPH|nr:integrase arm-type DNA-binding domain-containing protein [Rhodoblastus sphagnicola]MBB4196688.1 integrase [Rhodoblastus sphagnicola]PPQ26649.1 integrase [Rhodoblastus sphagnicola]